MSPLRVLMVGPDPAAQGGIASVLRGYLDAGFGPEVDLTLVVTHADSGARRRLGRYVRSLGETRRALREHRPDIVHIHLSMGGSLVRKGLVATLAAAHGAPFVLHVHGSHFDEHVAGLPAPARALVRRAFGRAEAVVALSAEWRERLARLAPGARVVVVPNGVPLPARTASLAGGPFVTFGRVEPRKGSFDLVEALSREAGVRLVMAGDGATAEVRALVAERGLGDRLDVREWIGPDERDALLEGAIGFVLPSYAEGLPMALLEAMAQGLPVVATPVGGIPEVVADGASGLLVQPGDVDAIAAALARLTADAELRRRLGAGARETIAAGFTRDAAMRKLVALWTEVANR